MVSSTVPASGASAPKAPLTDLHATSRKKIPMAGSTARSNDSVADGTSMPALSSDVFLSSGLDGQVMLWDRRVPDSATWGGVRRFESLSEGAVGRYCASVSLSARAALCHRADWLTCSQACWGPSGNEIFVARAKSTVEHFDIRTSSRTLSTLRLPASTGPISAVHAMPSGRHVLTASTDNVRLWDLDAVRDQEASTKVSARRHPFKIVVGHQGGMVSQMRTFIQLPPLCTD